MPYVEGESLRERLRRERQLPLEDALAISREIADALSYAHATASSIGISSRRTSCSNPGMH
jgi:serine/threonine protein kinase